jgi:hypothetical protein
MIHQCPKCGSTDISYDYSAVVTVHFEDGDIRYILVNDALTQNPDALFCNDCNEYSEASEQQAESVTAMASTVLETPVDEFTIYDRK